MPQFSRSREESRRTGQYHGRPAGNQRRKLIQQLLRVLAGALFVAVPVPAQTLLHIRAAEGEGAIHAAGSRDGRPIAVQITDETGRPVEAAVVTFRLPEEGPGGVFARGMKTEVTTTAPDGNAAVHGIAWNRLPGAFQIRITAVKGQVRAGTIVSQYISDAPQTARIEGGSRKKKWIAFTAIAAGAAAGLAAGMSKPPVPATSSPAPPPPQIGAPTITLGKP